MNLRSLELSFDSQYWVSDTDNVFKDIPKKITEWGDRYFLHKYEVLSNEEDLFDYTVILHNIPESTVTWLLLSTPYISIKSQNTYAPIAREVLELFDFGDDE